MSDVLSWDPAAPNNNSAAPDGLPEGMAPSTVNNAAREIMAAVKRWQQDIAGVKTSTGSSNAYALAAAQTITAYAAGQSFVFEANHANTGAATLNVDSVGAKSIKKNKDAALISGDINAGQIVFVVYDAGDDTFQLLSPTALVSGTGQFDITNLGLDTSVAGNNLTIAMKTQALGDPTTSDRVSIAFRNTSLAIGDYTIVGVTAALAVGVGAAASLGFANSTEGHIYVYALDNAGTVELALAKNAIFDEGILQTTTTIGASADDANTLYSTTGRTNVAVRLIARIRLTYGVAVWDTAPTEEALWLPSMKKTGDVVQQVNTQTGAVATGTTVMPADDTIPQNTEGDEYMTLAITPKNTNNTLIIEVLSYLSSGAAGYIMSTALFQDATAGALNVVSDTGGAANHIHVSALRHIMTAGTTSSTTFKIRAGAASAGTTTFNGIVGGRVFGGVAGSSIMITEIAA